MAVVDTLKMALAIAVHTSATISAVASKSAETDIPLPTHATCSPIAAVAATALIADKRDIGRLQRTAFVDCTAQTATTLSSVAA
jgi:hypothetical protein